MDRGYNRPQEERDGGALRFRHDGIGNSNHVESRPHLGYIHVRVCRDQLSSPLGLGEISSRDEEAGH